MWKLTPPNVDSVEQDLLDAFTFKIDRPPVIEPTAAEITAVKALYSAYDANLGRPADSLKGEVLGAELREAIKNAYGEVQETGRLKDLRSRLKLAPAHCPMCGFGPIQDLDHHLPKSIYKPLAIYPRNLVPSCSTCNKKKYTVAAGESSKHFFHVYLESLPDEIFFVADVALDPISGALRVEFSIQRPEAMSEELAQRLTFQADRLELNLRYPKEINTYLSSLSVSLEDAYGEEGNAEKLKNYLVRCASSHETKFGKNDWRPALLRGLALCEAFCNGGFRRALGNPNVGA